jgi:hypothetical protein
LVKPCSRMHRDRQPSEACLRKGTRSRGSTRRGLGVREENRCSHVRISKISIVRSDRLARRRDRASSGSGPRSSLSHRSCSFPRRERLRGLETHRSQESTTICAGILPAGHALSRRGYWNRRQALAFRASRRRTTPRRWFGTPNGIRTRVTCVKGRRPRPLDDGGRTTKRYSGVSEFPSATLRVRWGVARFQIYECFGGTGVRPDVA